MQSLYCSGCNHTFKNNLVSTDFTFDTTISLILRHSVLSRIPDLKDKKRTHSLISFMCICLLELFFFRNYN